LPWPQFGRRGSTSTTGPRQHSLYVRHALDLPDRRSLRQTTTPPLGTRPLPNVTRLSAGPGLHRHRFHRAPDGTSDVCFLVPLRKKRGGETGIPPGWTSRLGAKRAWKRSNTLLSRLPGGGEVRRHNSWLLWRARMVLNGRCPAAAVRLRQRRTPSSPCRWDLVAHSGALGAACLKPCVSEARRPVTSARREPSPAASWSWSVHPRPAHMTQSNTMPSCTIIYHVLTWHILRPTATSLLDAASTLAPPCILHAAEQYTVCSSGLLRAEQHPSCRIRCVGGDSAPSHTGTA